MGISLHVSVDNIIVHCVNFPSKLDKNDHQPCAHIRLIFLFSNEEDKSEGRCYSFFFFFLRKLSDLMHFLN